MKRKHLLAVTLLIALSACQTQSPAPPAGTPPNPVPSLTISPSSMNVNAGDAAITFSVAVQNSSESVTWTLSGPGTVSPTSGSSTAYTPPEGVDSTQSATLTATLGTTGASATSPIAIYAASVKPPSEPPEPVPPTTPPMTPPTTPPSGDTTPPTVVSVSPADGATGVTSDAKIVITFSEAMDEAATEKAYTLFDLPKNDVTVGWDSAGKVLTLTPKLGLSYAMSDPAISYTLSLKGAKDLAGNLLPAFESSFTTLKNLTYRLLSQPTLDGEVYGTPQANPDSPEFYVGDRSDNVSVRGFVSFDLSAIPESVSRDAVVDAELAVFKEKVVGSPYTGLNECTNPEFCAITTPIVLEHVSYGSLLDGSAYTTPTLAELGAISRIQSLDSSFETADVLSAVRDDLSNRGARKKLSQYRLSFTLETNGDAVADYVVFTSGNATANQPVLTISCLVP